MSTRPESYAEDRLVRLVPIAVMVLLAGLAGARLRSPDLLRPFEMDELVTVQFYTWAGVQDSGEEHRFRHIRDFYNLQRPGLKHLALGLYCSLGRWPEPNNHVPNSLLMNFTTLLQRSELASRLPAFVGALVFAAAMFLLCGPVLRWRAVAPLVVLWAWFWPYSVTFSQTARGYSWMVALQPLLLIALLSLAPKPSSVVRGALCAGVATLSLLNVISMAVDWVLPVYLAFLLIPPEAVSQEEQTTWRKNLMAQLLAIGGMGFLYYVAHLPSIYSGMQQYGLPFSSWEQLQSLTRSMIDNLLPDPWWKGLAAAGALGIVVMLITREHRSVAVLVLLVFAINTAHFLATRRLPYARTTAHLIPLLWMGAAFLVEFLIRAVIWRAAQAVVWIGAAAATALLVYPSLSLVVDEPGVRTRLRLASEAPAKEAPVYMPFGWGFDYLIAMYAPETWNVLEKVPPGVDLQISLFGREDVWPGGKIRISAGKQGTAVWDVGAWENKALGREEAGWRLYRMVGKTQAFPARDVKEKAIVIWYPEVIRLGINGQQQLDYVNSFDARYLLRYTRYQAKMYVYSILLCFQFLAETPDEYRKVESIVTGALERFGGHAVVWVSGEVPRE